ncbi:MAG: hypothetical protein ACXV95_09760, partial [Acidimicrobiales bacterium]
AAELERMGVDVRLLGPRGRAWPLRRRHWPDIPAGARVLVPGRPRALVLQKARSRVGECVAAALARASGARVVLDFDDPVRVRASTPFLLRMSTHVVLGHVGLLEGIRVPRGTEVVVIPTALPVASYERDGRPDGVLVAWLGSPEWAPPMIDLAEALTTGDHPLAGVTFRFVGTGDGPTILDPASVASVPASEVDWADEPALADLLADATVGLAPDRGTPGTGFKVLQYLAAGCLPLVERGGPGATYLAYASDELSRLCLVDDFAPTSVATALEAIVRLRSEDRASFDALVAECRTLARAWDVSEFCRRWLLAVGFGAAPHPNSAAHH